jgi:O-antigen/teichoic acid export membrane protein
MIASLWRDVAIYALGTILSRGIALLLLPLVTRALSPAEYGAFDLIVTCGVLVNLVVPLEISQALARLWNERSAGDAQCRLAGTAWTFTVLVYCAFAVFCLLAARPIANGLLGDARYVGAVRAGTLSIALSGVFYLLQNQFRWELRARAYAVVGVGYALANLLLVAGAAWVLQAGLEGVLWAQAMAAALAIVASLAMLRGSLRIGIVRVELAEMLRFSLPLVPAGIAVFASFYANRLLLNALATLQDVGMFGVASRIASLATLVLVGVQGALTPLVYAHHHEPQTPAALARLLEGFTAVALTACLAVGLFATQLVTLLATGDYVSVAPLLIWLALAALLAQMYLFAPGIAIAKKTDWQLLITLASGALAVGLNALLIPRWGVWGATLATLAAAAMFFGAWLAISQRLYRLPLRYVPLAGALVLFVALSVAARHVDRVWSSGIGLWAAKCALLSVFGIAMFASGLLRPSALRARASGG